MSPGNAIQLLVKAGLIVDELARRGALSASELAKATCEPRPSVYRIVEALRQIEAVQAAGEGRFGLGTAMLRWSDAAVESFVDRASLGKQLRWVRDQLGMNAYFCVAHDEGVLCLDHVDGTAVDMLDLRQGRMLPRHAGAASTALLAFAADDVRHHLLAAAPFEVIAPNTPTTAEELRARFDQTVARGWSVDDGDLVEGVAAVAVPVHRADGTTAGAISVAGLRASILAQQSIAARVLQQAAHQMSAAMPMFTAVPMGGTHDHGGEGNTGFNGPRSPSLVIKAGALMEALAAERLATSARLIELIDEPASSVYRMIATLADIGWVEQIAPRGAYRIGPKMLALASDLTRHLDIRRAAMPVLRSIHDATGETTFLCIRHGTRAVCIERIDGVRVNSRVLRLGQSLPLHVGAAPRALLAFEDREAWAEYTAIAAPSENSGHDISRSALYAELEDIRHNGVAVSDNIVTPGIAAVGAPIFDSRGAVAASLSVSGLRDGILAEPPAVTASVTDLVRSGAQELSRYLGFTARWPP
ncbi:IclR family transcriptional regulator [Mycobacterium sp. 852013-50091_SCH5140682]|uniref:IclR family transcriptional regulator n=1 Tax=Mycobacterium sp. 852013-50091_SCH5140682 TaxID=1834109 RepID=UPI0007EBB258|nr:IclR family transcriptional regulator [Mycobacterium sp. 852013-50091_SCH5140682]OBC07009.1 IclR family transcriptional regulator [Mycobacterium sp. 852013-50091_SCH5140682]